MKKKIVWLLCSALLLTILSACGGNDDAPKGRGNNVPTSVSSAVTAPVRSTTLAVTVANVSGYNFQELYVSPTGTNNWGEDHLGSTSILKNNGSYDISMPSGVCEPEERSPCMNKIDKLDKELEKAREKAAEWQAKIRELEKQKQEEENSQIVQAVRSLKLTPAQLMAFLNDPKNSLTASGHTDPKPEAPEKEDTAHEEN